MRGLSRVEIVKRSSKMTLDYQRFVLIPKSEGNATISDLMMCRGNCVLLPASDRFGQEHGPRHLYESTCARRLRMSFFWHGQYQVVLSCFLAYLIGVSCELTFHKGQSVVEIIHSKIVYHFAITHLQYLLSDAAVSSNSCSRTCAVEQDCV